MDEVERKEAQDSQSDEKLENERWELHGPERRSHHVQPADDVEKQHNEQLWRARAQEVYTSFRSMKEKRAKLALVQANVAAAE